MTAWHTHLELRSGYPSVMCTAEPQTQPGLHDRAPLMAFWAGLHGSACTCCKHNSAYWCASLTMTTVYIRTHLPKVQEAPPGVNILALFPCYLKTWLHKLLPIVSCMLLRLLHILLLGLLGLLKCAETDTQTDTGPKSLQKSLQGGRGKFGNRWHYTPNKSL